MLILAVTIHNIPEGISGGAVFAGLLMNNSKVTLAGAFALSIGIAIQNVPEGFIVSLPVRSEKGRIKAFLYGMFSGIVEPIGGGITTVSYTHLIKCLQRHSTSDDRRGDRPEKGSWCFELGSS